MQKYRTRVPVKLIIIARNERKTHAIVSSIVSMSLVSLLKFMDKMIK